MKIYCTYIWTLCTLSLWTGNATAADVENGKALYEQHCTRCHTEEIFQRPERIVHTEQQLIERIRQCELGNELAWFEEEVNDVAAYLAQEFYNFDAE